jgi:tetratricopeptide (TPR) repeat protein
MIRKNRLAMSVAFCIVLQSASLLVFAADEAWDKAYKKGIACMDAQDFAGAEAYGKTAVALAKTASQKQNAFVFLSDAASSKNDYPVAISALTQFMTLVEKTSPDVYKTMQWRRAKAYAVHGDYEKAISDFNQVEPTCKGSRNISNLMRDRGTVYEKLKQYDKSIADLTKSLKAVDQILGAKDNEVTIERVKADKISLLYQRSKLLALAGKADDSKRDKILADKLTEAW